MKVHEATTRRLGRGLLWFLTRCLVSMEAIGMTAVLGTGANAATLTTSSNLSTLVGDWLAPAEDADDVDAIVSLAHGPQGWTVHIKAIRVTRPDQAWRDDSVCAACSGPAKGQPLKGLLIAWGWQERDGALVLGQILDPSDGRVYDCEIQAAADGKSLRVLAYRGLRLLGHTMVWTRP